MMEIISLVKRQQPRIRGHYNSIRTRSADPPIPDPQIPRSPDPQIRGSQLEFEVRVFGSAVSCSHRVIKQRRHSKSPRDETKRRTGDTKHQVWPYKKYEIKSRSYATARQDFDSARRQTGASSTRPLWAAERGFQTHSNRQPDPNQVVAGTRR